MDRPLESNATGTLRAKGLSLSLPLGVPVTLEDFSLRAQDSQMSIEQARLLWGEGEFVLEGDVSFSSEGFVLDMDLLAEELVWGKIQEALDREKGTEDAPQQADSQSQNDLDGLAVEGVVRVKADSFTFKEFTWRPLAAEVLLEQEGFEILLKEADLCGVSTAGTVKILPEQLAIDLEISCQEEKIENVLDCIEIDVEATGDCSFKVKLSGRGQAEDPLQWLQGDFELDCREGTILQDPFISAVLSFLNTAEILRGKLPDYKTQGFPYNSIQAHGILLEGGVESEEFVIDGTTVDVYAVGEVDMVERTMNVRVLVSSLQTVEFIVSKIPLVSYLLGGRGVTAVPMRVYGPLDQLRTVPVSPAALGEDLLGIMGRTLRLPYAAVKWFFPPKEKQAEVH